MGNLEGNFVVQIDGGIGRVLCAVPALEKLSELRKVSVLTSFPEVFMHNPKIYKTYSLNREYLWDDVIKHGHFLFPEPYFNHLYYNQIHHLMQSFNFLLTGDAGHVSTPNLYLTEDEKAWASNFMEMRKQEFPGKDVVLLQCFGSTAMLGEGGTTQDPTHRSLPSYAADAICRNTNHLYVNISHIPMDYSNVWQQQFTLRQLFALAAHCDFVISIDSCLSHIGAAFGKRGLVFFGGTFPQNLSYPSYRVIQREGYPKHYHPNRFSGFVDENQDALSFDTGELDKIIEVINAKDFEPAQI